VQFQQPQELRLNAIGRFSLMLRASLAALQGWVLPHGYLLTGRRRRLLIQPDDPPAQGVTNEIGLGV
jgi:hypothetical protein